MKILDKQKKLMNKFEISNKLISFNQHNSLTKYPLLLMIIKERKSVALVSDAGMPSICDPGENLIQKVRENKGLMLFVSLVHALH